MVKLSGWSALLGSALVGFGVFGAAIAAEGVPAPQKERPSVRPPIGQRKSVEQLVGILQTHAGGALKIGLARKAGINLASPIAPSFSVVIERDKLREGNFLGQFYSVDVIEDATFKLRAGSRAIFRIQLPKNGWYMINVEGALLPNQAIAAQMREVGFQSGPFQSWTYPANTNSQPAPKSFPALLEYKGKGTGFEFYVQSGEMTFERVTVEAL